MLKGILSNIFRLRSKVTSTFVSDSDDVEKPFLEHLEDLRKMLMRMALALCITTLGTFFFYKRIFEFFKEPLRYGVLKDGSSMLEKVNFIFTSPAEGFTIAINVSLMAGICLSLPLLLYFLLQFILPGLKGNEKRVLWPSLIIGFGLFMSGAAFCFFIILPKALVFFNEINVSLGGQNFWTVGQYISFATKFIFIFGICFELPVPVMALVKLDIINFSLMRKHISWAIILIFVASAVITPTGDAMTMTMLAAPMLVLYGICLFLAWLIEKKDRKENPDFYKDKEELEVKEDWNNETYNPWEQDLRDDSLIDDKPMKLHQPDSDASPKNDNKSLEEYSIDDLREQEERDKQNRD